MEPERKTRREEEIAAIFGDTDEVMIFSEEIHIDHNMHELVIDVHPSAGPVDRARSMLVRRREGAEGCNRGWGAGP
jgi:hypothetical protein